MKNLKRFCVSLLVCLMMLINNSVLALTDNSGDVEINKTANKTDTRVAQVNFNINPNSFNTSKEKTDYDNVDIALVIDASGSMNDMTDLNGKSVSKLFALKESAKNLINTLLSQENNKFNISITTFNKEGSIKHNLSNNKTTLINTINNISTTNGTNIQDGINKGGSTLINSKNKKIVILLSDGNANKQTYTSKERSIYYYNDGSISYNCQSNCNADNSTLLASNYFKNKDMLFYTIGFGTNSNANKLLTSIAGDASRFNSVNDGTNLLNTFKTITQEVIKINQIGNDAILIDVIPNDFYMSDKEKERLKNLYGDKISITSINEGIKIEYRIGDLIADNNINFNYEIIAHDKYHGSMYTNDGASLKFKPNELNPYDYILDDNSYTTIKIDNPFVLIPAITQDDYLGKIGVNKQLEINPSQLLNNDNSSYFELGKQTEGVIKLNDEIIIVDYPKNGKLEYKDGKYIYISSDITTNDTFTYKIKTSVMDAFENLSEVFSNVSTVSIDTVKQTSKVIVNYIDSDGNKLINSKVLESNVGDGYKTTEESIKGWKLKSSPENKSGKFTDETIEINYIYEQDVKLAYVDTGVDSKNIYGGMTLASGLLFLIIRKKVKKI